MSMTLCFRSSAAFVAITAGVVAALVAGCHTPKAPGPQAQTWGETQAPGGDEEANAERAEREAKRSKLSPEAYAKALPSASRCEYEARRYYEEVSSEKGWKLLVGCVKRGDFTHLKPLLEEPWLTELGTRRGAAELLAHVMATRGGDVTGDLLLLHEKRVPVFSLASAIAEPDVYKDRLIIMRGRVGERRKNGQRFAATIAETSLESAASERTLGPKSVREYAGESRSSYSASGSYKTSRYGSGAGRYNSTRSSTGSGRSTDKVVDEVYDNVVVETGNDVIANLQSADPLDRKSVV